MRHTPSEDAKRRLTTQLGVRLINPLVKAALEAGLAPPGVALLETTGRRSGEPRRTPVGNGLDGDVFWLVAEHGRRSAYVRNIEADPRVRVKVGRRWRGGVAKVLPHDDPRRRQRRMGRRVNARAVRAMGTQLLTVRIDLAPETMTPLPRHDVVDGLAGGAVAAVLSGVPSTLHALLVTGRPLEAGLAAGSLLLPRERRRGRLLLAAIPVHLALSLGWGTALAHVLPRRRPLAAGALGGLAIAALDLRLIGRRFPRIAALPQAPQVADHVAFGLVTAAVVRGRRRRRA